VERLLVAILALLDELLGRALDREGEHQRF
jgi:hypothetical protein